MKKSILCIILSLFVSLFAFSQERSHGLIRPVPFTAVHVTDAFWSQRLDTLRTKTIRYAFEKCEKAGYIDNFAIAGGLKKGKYQSLYPFDDAEVYKVIEGAAYLLSVQKDPALEAYIDSVITIIASAQEPDGYLFTNKTINNPLHPWVSVNRWENDWNLSHETFNMGELYEAAIAYYYATGKRTLLDVAIRNADLVCQVFHEGGIVMSPGHAVIEMALARLYEATGDEKYLRQARFFLECRGRKKHDSTSEDLRRNGKYWQDHLPAIQQREAVGHAVRALYFYSGMADIAIHLGDQAYLEAIDGIWENIVGKKMYLTGGLGSTAHNEAFGKNYELPNASAYCETCASIANCMFNLRMFRLHGKSDYFDVLERSLYNTVLSGISISGDQFFYPNVLEADRKGQVRSLWFGCSCCPTNLSRFIPAIPGYVYATDESSIYTNLFIASTSEIDFGGKKVELCQQTNYPWEGEVDIVVRSLETDCFDLKIRIPGWADNEAVPSDLYRYTEKKEGLVKIKINDVPYAFKKENGYAVLSRRWQKGDQIHVSLPMEVRQVVTHDAVKTNNNLVAVERGPLVYCAEFADNQGSVFNLSIPEKTNFKVNKTARFLNGAYVVEGAGKRYSISPDKKSVKAEDATIRFIPYYARAYREAGEMKVWLPVNGETIQKHLYDESRVVDEVIIGHKKSEEAHALKGENTRSDESGGWRDADNGWFSYDLAVRQDEPLELVLTYHSTDGGNRSFEIWVDERKIAEQSLRTETFDLFMDTAYPLPAGLIQGKKKVTVTLKALPGNIAGGIFGCKIQTVSAPGKDENGRVGAASNVSTTFLNPLRRGADPFMVKQDGKYYTIFNKDGGFAVTESRFLTRFEREEVVWLPPKNAWNSFNLWAPEIHPINGKWYIYYAGSVHEGTPFYAQRAGVLEADHPFGLYTDKGMFYTGDDPEGKKDNCWSIDMTVLQHKGKNYAIWSGWDRLHDHHDVDQYLYIAELINPWTLGKRVLLSKPELAWEKGDHIILQEGAQVLTHGEDVFILYSTRGSWGEHYKVGQLRLKSADSDLLDPSSWIKSPEPVFQGNPKVYGVGHASLITSPDDKEYWIYYHSKLNLEGGWDNRHVYLQRFTFDANGNPQFGEAKGGGEMTRPSGEVEIEKKDKKLKK